MEYPLNQIFVVSLISFDLYFVSFEMLSTYLTEDGASSELVNQGVNEELQVMWVREYHIRFVSGFSVEKKFVVSVWMMK